MRINNQDYPNASMCVVGERRVLGPAGVRKIFVYEARVKRGAVTQKRASENLAELQDWILLKVGGRMQSA